MLNVPLNFRQLTQKPIFFVFIVAIVGLSVAGLTYYFTHGVGNASGANSTIAQDVAIVVKQVGKLMLLPTDEIPTVAAVADVTKLVNQPFFAQAQNGDQVLIYNQKKQAILYRPSTNIIIEVAPINVTAATPSADISVGATGSLTKSSPTPTIKPSTFTIYNGTKTSGLTKTYEVELKKAIPQAMVVSRSNSAGEFDKSFLIDVKGDQAETLAKYAQILGMATSTLPSGETKPAADFLIILGTDKTN